jgi:hypothetical protein
MGRTGRILMLALVFALVAACGRDGERKSGAASASASVSVAPAPPPPPPAESAEPVAKPAPPAAAPVDAGMERPAAPKIRRRPGLAGELFGRARALKLDDEQRAVLDRLDQELWGPRDEQELKTALKELVGLLVAGVKAGRIDTAKLAPHHATIEQAAAARREREADALGELHGVLEPAQRKRLVEMVRRAHPAKPSKPKKSAKAVEPERKREAERSKRRLARVAALLGLDEAQKRRVDAVLVRFDPEQANKAHSAELDKRRQALLAIFEQDDPDASQLDLGAGPRAMLQHRVAFLTALLGVIKANQRDKLARTIERPAGTRWAGVILGQPGPVADT